jgi:hypothetical protein
LLGVVGCFASTDLPPDNTPPQLSFSTPTNGAALSGTVNVEITAFDDTSVERVQLFIDGSLRATFYTRPYFHRWNVTGLPAGSSHTLRAEGIDGSENKGTVEITVTVQGGGPS